MNVIGAASVTVISGFGACWQSGQIAVLTPNGFKICCGPCTKAADNDGMPTVVKTARCDDGW
jgi:hypothetical protein